MAMFGESFGMAMLGSFGMAIFGESFVMLSLVRALVCYVSVCYVR